MRKILVFMFILGILIIPCVTITDNEPPKIERNESIIKDEILENKLQNLNLYNKIFFIGDSRFVGMEKFNEGDFFKAKVGEGYSYLLENLPEVLKEYQSNDYIVIGLGVNDLYNIKNYVAYINSLASNYNLCFITIGPVDVNNYGDSGYSVTNEEIDDFNLFLKENLSNEIVLIDINQFLIEDGYNTIDGLHYDNYTYEKIYKYIKKYLQEEI